MRWAWLLLVLVGCDDEDSEANPAPDGVDGGVEDLGCLCEAGPADATVRDANPHDAMPLPSFGAWTVGRDDDAWRISHDGEVVLSIVGQRTATGAPDVRDGFGAFMVDLRAMAWSASDAVPTFELRGDHLWVAVGTEADATELSWTREGDYMGLGSQTTGMFLAEGKYPLWTQEQGIGKPEGGVGFPLANVPEAAYAPMGVWHATNGLTAIIGHDHFSELELTPSTVSLRSLGAPVSMLLIAGETPKERLSAVTEIVGRIQAPPPWVFGPWNDAVGGPERLEEVATRLREEDIPSSAVWSEDWIGGEQTASGFRLSYAWAWDPETYPDLAADIERLHARGFAFLGYFNPFVPEPTAMWGEGVAGGFLIHDAAGEVLSFLDPAFRNASLVDLTNPDARAWLDGYLTTAVADLGIDGWMADFAEWLPVEAVMHSGETGWAAHNRYPLDWQRANREAFDRARPDGDYTFFARSGWASVNGGSAGLTPTMWGGDQDTDWAPDDGIPSVVPIAVHLGLSGVPIFGSDIAGYSSFATTPNTTKELFFRWASMGAFHPLMRTHHGSDECGNWAFDRDAESVAHYRRWAVVHTLLYPEWRRLAAEAVDTGWPITRHPYLVEPDADWWRDGRRMFFIGDDLLVMPILEAGADALPEPPEDWQPLFGPAMTAPPTELPVFVRPGTTLTLLPRPVDSHYGATEAGITDLADVEGERTLALYPAADGTLRDFAGAGWDAPDWAAATVDEAPIDCEADRCTVEGPGVFTAGTATLTLPAGTWHLALGPDAWAEWAEPTPLTDLDPDIPPPCEAEE